MDEDIKRRGQENVLGKLRRMFEDDKDLKSKLFASKRENYVVSLAIILGNSIRTMGLKALETSGFDPLLIGKANKIYNDADFVVNIGQWMDKIYEKDVPTLNEYLSMINQKTANLFRASTNMGATFANAPAYIEESLGFYAKQIGLAFQIQDDILDTKPEKGNTPGSDIRCGKNTILLLKSKELADDRQKMTLDAVVKNKKATDSDIQSVIKIMHDTGAIEYARETAFSLVTSAKIRLEQVARIAKRQNTHLGNLDFLNDYADYTVSRLK